MNNIQIFNNPEFGKIRTLEKDGEPWFVSKDVAEALGYERADNAVRSHVDDDDKLMHQISASGQNRNMTIINESGLYSLVLSSKLPTAKKFKRWVTSEVIPSIRRHGVYAVDELLNDPDMAIKAFTALKEEREKNKQLTVHNAQLEQKVSEYEPKAQYVDKILESTGAVTTTQIAADYGLSAWKLNKILHEERIQRNVGGQWILYKEHMGLGYTKSETVPIVRSDGTQDVIMQTKWTQKGRLMLHNLLERRGIYANMDKV